MATQDTSDLVHTLDNVVCGHHVYKRIWTPTVGEQLQLRPGDNESDPRAVAVLKHGVIVGHLPRKTARTVWLFLKQGGKSFRTFNFAFRFLRAGNKLAICNYQTIVIKPVIRYQIRVKFPLPFNNSYMVLSHVPPNTAHVCLAKIRTSLRSNLAW